MRLTEQKKLMILSVFGIVIILSTLGIQLIDAHINETNSDAFLKQGRVNNDALLLIHYLQTYNQYSVYQVLDANITFFDDNLDAIRLEEMKQVYQEYENSNITDDEAIQQFKNIIYKEIEVKSMEYLEHHIELENIAYEDFVDYKIHLVTLQVTLVIISLIGYIDLYRAIKKREIEYSEKSKRKKKKN